MPKATGSLHSGGGAISSKDSNANSPSPPSAFRTKLIALSACTALLIFFYTMAVLGISHKSPTMDEPSFLVGGWAQWHYSDFRVNNPDPPLWKYLAVLGTSADQLKIIRNSSMWNAILDSDAGNAFTSLTFFATGADYDPIILYARARMALVGVALGIAITWCAWRLAGPAAAVIAAVLFCFDPNFLAHSALVKNDVAMSLCFLLAMASVWTVGEKATLARCSLLALMTGAALTTKFSGVIIIPMLGLALICRILIPRPWPILKWTARNPAQRLLSAVAITLFCAVGAYIVIWAVYGFRFSPGPVASELFDRHWLAQTNAAPRLIDRLYDWADGHQLLPQTWLYGLYYTFAHGGSREAFLLGQYSLKGWWYYFPIAMAFKTPLATIAALLLAITLWLRRQTSRQSANSQTNLWPICAFVICPVIYMAVVMAQNLNLGLRYILPVYPFLYIFIAVMAARVCREKPRLAGSILIVLFLGLAAESLGAFPNFIPFFNAAAGGPRQRAHILGDSNLDWGQDLPSLADWQKQNPDKQIYLCYFGCADPTHYGIRYIRTVAGNGPLGTSFSPRLTPVLALSVTAMQGIYLTPDQRAYYTQFLNENPFAIAGGSIYLFDKIENRLPPVAQDDPFGSELPSDNNNQ